MQTRTTLDQIEVRTDGAIHVKLLKQVVAPGGTIVFSEPHRTLITPPGDAAAQKSLADSHLSELGFPPIAEADWQSVLAQAAAKWTPEIVAAWQARDD